MNDYNGIWIHVFKSVFHNSTYFCVYGTPRYDFVILPLGLGLKYKYSNFPDCLTTLKFNLYDPYFGMSLFHNIMRDIFLMSYFIFKIIYSIVYEILSIGNVRPSRVTYCGRDWRRSRQDTTSFPGLKAELYQFGTVNSSEQNYILYEYCRPTATGTNEWIPIIVNNKESGLAYTA
ncbi:hypothetical protein QTP88_014598 [Uroleucon formosanum]